LNAALTSLVPMVPLLSSLDGTRPTLPAQPPGSELVFDHEWWIFRLPGATVQA
jgi:hypothetical protein